MKYFCLCYIQYKFCANVLILISYFAITSPLWVFLKGNIKVQLCSIRHLRTSLARSTHTYIPSTHTSFNVKDRGRLRPLKRVHRGLKLDWEPC